MPPARIKSSTWFLTMVNPQLSNIQQRYWKLQIAIITNSFLAKTANIAACNYLRKKLVNYF